jgi:hypothetical protein
MRMRFVPLLLNYAAFGLFIILRPPAVELLDKLDREWQEGAFSITSGQPYTYVADRPLYSWSAFHGGERLAVKLMEIANLPGLAVAGALTPSISMTIGASIYHGRSWVRAWLFLALASLQWIGIGVLLERPRKDDVA